MNHTELKNTDVPQAVNPYSAPKADLGQYGAGGGVYAGFWLRFVAYVLDAIIVGIPFWIVMYATMPSMSSLQGASQQQIEAQMNPFAMMSNLLGLASIVVGWLYHAFMESSSKQATLGKMALGIKVVDVNGNRIGFGRATGRYFGKIVSGIILYIGFIMAGFTQKKQALHDMMASTLVVKK